MQSELTLTDTSSRALSGWQLIRRTLLAISLLLMLGHFVIYLGFGVALIPFPFDYDQAEGFELNNAILMAEGRCPYCDNNIFPFFASGYAPFYHILMIPFVWLFGAEFWYGRLLIFIATLLTSSFIGWAVHRETKHWGIAVLSGLAFLASNFIYHIGPLLRQHLLMVMLETAAVVVIATAFKQTPRERRKRLLLSFMLLLFAGYTKQLAYSTCIAVFLWVLLRQPRAALVYGFSLSVVAGLIFGGWMLITEGQWWINIIRSNQNPYITEQFTGLMRQFLRLHYPLMTLAGLLVIFELYFSRLSVYSIWFVVSFASTIGAGKWGAGDSYFATTLAAACILAGIFAARSWQNQWRFPQNNYIVQLVARLNLQSMLPLTQMAAVISLGLFVIYGVTVIKFPTSGLGFGAVAKALNIEPAPGHRYPLYDSAGWTVGYAVTGHFPSQSDYQNGWYIVEQVANTEGYVMSEDAGFSIQAGREVVTNAVQLNNLWENDLFDPTNLLNMIEQHEFGLIILRARFFPPPILIAIETHYELKETVPMNGFEYELWIPKTSES